MENDSENLKRLVAEGKVKQIELTFDADAEGRTWGAFFGAAYKRGNGTVYSYTAREQATACWDKQEVISMYLWRLGNEERRTELRLAFYAAFEAAFYEAYNG